MYWADGQVACMRWLYCELGKRIMVILVYSLRVCTMLAILDGRDYPNLVRLWEFSKVSFGVFCFEKKW